MTQLFPFDGSEYAPEGKSLQLRGPLIQPAAARCYSGCRQCLREGVAALPASRRVLCHEKVCVPG